jgi:arginine kinase
MHVNPNYQYKNILTRNMVVYLEDCRKKYLNGEGEVDWSVVADRWQELSTKRVSLANKFFTADVRQQASELSQENQQVLLDIIMGGLENDDSGVGAYATSPQDYDTFAFFLEPLIREYHGIQGNTVQEHNWDIPVGEYLLTNIHPSLTNVSMRARVARNVKGWNLPPKMNKDERLRFEEMMVNTFNSFSISGKYNSLTPGHAN